MKKVKKILLLALLCSFICIFSSMSGLVTKASYLETNWLLISSVTTKSITVDISANAAKFKEVNPDYNMEPYEIRVRVWNNTKNNSLIKTLSVDANATSYKITGLTPGKRYNIELYYRYSGPHTTGTSSFEGDFSTRRKDTAYPITFLGRTDTTMSLSLKEGIEQLKKDLAERNCTDFQTGYFFWGHAVESKTVNTKKALDKARKLAYKTTTSNYMSSSRLYKKLKPGTGHAFCVMAAYSYKDSKGVLQIGEEYFELSGVKTDVAGAYTQDDIGDTTPEKWCNDRDDAGTKDKHIFDVTKEDYYSFNIKSSSTADSVTIDWSSCEGIKTPGKSKNYLAAIIEDPDYDAFKDMEKNGYWGNYGPNVRKAIQKVKTATKSNKVAKGKTSFTATKLKKNTRYLAILKCGRDGKGIKYDTCYVVKRIYTTGDSARFSEEALVKSTYLSGYMYDFKVKREGDTFLVDWADAKKNFSNQEIFKKYPVKQETIFRVRIGAEPVSDCKTNKDIERAYREAYRNNDKAERELPATRARVYGLDMSKKYVFSLQLDFCFYAEGDMCYFSEQFYCDETSEKNYLHKKALGLIKEDPVNPKPDPDKPEPDKPDPNKPEPNKPEPNKPEPNKPEPNKPTPAKPGNGSSDNDNNSSDGYSYGGAQSGSNDKTPAKASTGGSNEKMVPVGKKADNKAWIYVSGKKLKAADLKKSSKKLSIKVENSEGKISIKNASSNKLKNYVKFKVKGRNISVKFKKGAPKGTYKFKVTVKAHVDKQKTTQTIKVVVK